ncbi:hypothetical protein [Aureispira anguillae]|uniref:Uncharacterized protein n=1 Tax=Aureispira anguillae TaxID=2864201 RepID=A0A915YE54_9BACT|nr:hypothetical protein [Aureispira anguillae]BDS11385.1 hypothetical protein AsAng_0020990 [Aureispira anguillae]
MANNQANNTKAFLLILVPISLFFLFLSLDLSWENIKTYTFLGIPLGVILVSFVGSLFKLIYTLYQEDEINSFFKLIVVRSLMGIILGAILFLFLNSFVDAKESVITYLVVFVAGIYSDLAITKFLESTTNQILREKTPSIKGESTILDDSSFIDDNSEVKE